MDQLLSCAGCFLQCDLEESWVGFFCAVVLGEDGEGERVFQSALVWVAVAV